MTPGFWRSSGSWPRKTHDLIRISNEILSFEMGTLGVLAAFHAIKNESLLTSFIKKRPDAVHRDAF